MVYIFLFSYIILYSYLVRVKDDFFSFCLFFFPIGVLLLLIISLQYNVGTDYFTYISLAQGTKDSGWIENNNEFLFLFLLNLAGLLGEPQSIFLLAGIIQVFFFMLISYRIQKIGFNLYFFFFLYFFFLVSFFNQFNGIRQYIAVYIVVYSLLILEDDNFLISVFLVFIASYFHSSAIYLLSLVFLKPLYKYKIPFNLFLIVFIVFLIISIQDLSDVLSEVLSFTKYSYYADSDFFKPMSFEGIITKIPKVLIFLFTAYILEKYYTFEMVKYRFYMNLSYIAILLMILSFSSSVIWRFYHYVDLFIMFPLLILLQIGRQKQFIFLIVMSLLFMVIMKVVVMPRGEYLYNSILFK